MLAGPVQRAVAARDGRDGRSWSSQPTRAVNPPPLDTPVAYTRVGSPQATASALGISTRRASMSRVPIARFSAQKWLREDALGYRTAKPCASAVSERPV